MSQSVFDKLKQHFLKHRFCYISFGLFLFVFQQMIIVFTVTPIRCKMWEGKELEVFLTPEEWRKLSGVNESLKETEWVYYPAIEGKAKKDPFFIKNQGLYQPVMYFNGNKHDLDKINNKYPYLNLYSYITPTKVIGHNTFILYDQKLKKIIVQYNEIEGYFETNIFVFSGQFRCDKNSLSKAYRVLEKYFY